MAKRSYVYYEKERSLLDQLLEDSRLYKDSYSYFELLKSTARLRNFAPFNALLLDIQRPGITYAASASVWWRHYGREIVENARPLLILWPFGPVALVYDVQDTEGMDLPEDMMSFLAYGDITSDSISIFVEKMAAKNIYCDFFDGGDGYAGSIRLVYAALMRKTVRNSRRSNHRPDWVYRMGINRNHNAPTQFSTIAHELGHLFLGHLGPDKILNIPEPRGEDLSEKEMKAKEELEAESVAYLVCTRNGVKTKSEKYLSNYVNEYTTMEDLDLYQVMRAAGQIETLLGLTKVQHFF